MKCYKKIFSVLFMTIFLYLLSSCATDSNSNVLHSSTKEYCVIVSPNEKTLIELATLTYSEAELSDIINFDGSLDELNSVYPAECIRATADVYRVSYCGNDNVATIVFDKSGNRLLGKTYTLEHTKNEFDAFTKSNSLEDVQEFSPNGEYLFLYTGRNDSPRVSTHCTRDGYMITIEYDDNYQIISISCELI